MLVKIKHISSRHRYVVSLDFDLPYFPHLVLFFISQLLLAMSGDIEINPSPLSDSFSLDNSPSACSYINLTNSGFSIIHLNIHSLKPKIHFLTVEAQPYFILVFTETWLSNTVSNDNIHIPNLGSPFRCDRTDRIGTGVAVY